MAITNGRPVNRQLMPHLIVKDVDASVDFYRRAFGAEEVFRTLIPDGSNRRHHCHVRIGDSTLALTLENPKRSGPVVKSPETLGGVNGLIEMFVDDVDDWCRRAEAEGAQVFRKPEDMFFGDRYSQVIDPNGYVWAFSTPKETMTQDECTTRMHEFYQRMGLMPAASAGTAKEG